MSWVNSTYLFIVSPMLWEEEIMLNVQDVSFCDLFVLKVRH
ncbi:hypothetical protein PLUTE_b0341 [Pseudoalteromonas luteoviolacea DSM 6061]|nr:hypothetical protein [Pseudoalteromonas luteoviolacea DSM 6061]